MRNKIRCKFTVALMANFEFVTKQCYADFTGILQMRASLVKLDTEYEKDDAIMYNALQHRHR